MPLLLLFSLQMDPQSCASPTNASSYVCVDNEGVFTNARTASLFSRGTLERYGSRYKFVFQNSSNGGCVVEGDSGVEVLSSYNKLVLVSLQMGRRAAARKSEPQYCTGRALCIVTGDEYCLFDPKWPHSDHIIFRQYVQSGSRLLMVLLFWQRQR